MRKLSTHADSPCKYAQMDWSHLEYFLAVARTGSLSSAAKQLRVNHSTVARRLEKLEQQLNVRLFDRLNNGYQLTADGLALRGHAAQVAGEINKIEGIFSGSEAALRGTLRISKPSSGLLNLAPLLVAFHRRYPNIDLVLTAGGERSEVTRMEADVVIRLTNNPPQELIARKLGQLPINLFGSRAYLEHAGMRDLADHDWLIWQDEDSLLNMEPALKRNIPNARIVLRTNSYNELLEAVNAGMGISLLSPLQWPSTHQLQPITPQPYEVDQGVWLLSHPDLRNRERIRVFKDFMIEHLSATLANYWEAQVAPQ